MAISGGDWRVGRGGGMAVLLLLRRWPRRADVLVSDLGMPDQDGST